MYRVMFFDGFEDAIWRDGFATEAEAKEAGDMLAAAGTIVWIEAY